MKLSRAEYSKLHSALVSAFPSYALLERMLRLKVGELLPRISPPGPLDQVAFEIICWAEAHDRVHELLAGARSANPDNKLLAEAAESLGLTNGFVRPPSPEGPPGDGSPEESLAARGDKWTPSSDSELMTVLAAGTGSRVLPCAVEWASRQLGIALAEAGYKLVVGGWHGVDYVVAEAFATVLQRRGQPLSTRLTQVVIQGGSPEFVGGRVEYVPKGAEEFLRSIDLCDAVVAVGGVGGTLQVCRSALQEQKPVFPLVGTGGDAARIYREMLASWDHQPVSPITPREFRRLDGSIHSAEDAKAVIDELMELLEKVELAKHLTKGPSRLDT